MCTCLFTQSIRVLCCNECGKEIWIEPEQKVPEVCPSCLQKFKHGWDALIKKVKKRSLD